MKKTISILLLSCLVIYVGGYHLVYAVYQCGLKREMKAYLKTHTNPRYGTYLHFALADEEIRDPSFSWEEENEEFTFRGEWYDVVTVDRSGDSIRICALRDERENDLDKQVREIHQAAHQGNPAQSTSYLKFFSAFYISDPALPVFAANAELSYVPAKEKYFQSCGPEVNLPPPRC
ncbi:MAG: hypothetical protein JWQ78_1098 [Sediminibacterium sp.]|nr:hypothetical protein [Sediminibacterium sp.]